MRRRTPSEIKAYGDGYAEAYKQFCHLLKRNDKDKAIRKMGIFAKGVEITVETAMDEPNSSEKPNNSTSSKMEQVDKDINVRSKDEPQTEDDKKHCVFCKWVYEPNVCGRCRNMNLFADTIETEPQTDCAWR